MTSDEPRRLYRSETDRMISGVCGGIADYLAVDPAIVRIVFVVAVLANGAGLLVYLVLAIVLPKRSSVAQIGEETVREGVRDLEDRARYLASEAQRIASDVGSGRGSRPEEAEAEEPTGGETGGAPTADRRAETRGPTDPEPPTEDRGPMDPEPPTEDTVGPAQRVDPGPSAPASTPPVPASASRRGAETRSRNRMVMGWLLVAVGGWLLLGQLGLRLPDWLGALLWPAVLIAVGLLLLLRRR